LRVQWAQLSACALQTRTQPSSPLPGLATTLADSLDFLHWQMMDLANASIDDRLDPATQASETYIRHRLGPLAAQIEQLQHWLPPTPTLCPAVVDDVCDVEVTAFLGGSDLAHYTPLGRELWRVAGQELKRLAIILGEAKGLTPLILIDLDMTQNLDEVESRAECSLKDILVTLVRKRIRDTRHILLD
jgi:hypothetical protein